MIHIPPLPLQLPLQLQLPLLIKEKVEFYYYRQLWLEKIKIMHEQYRKCVKLKDYYGREAGNNLTWNILTWTDYTKEIYTKFICATGEHSLWRNHIYNFTKKAKFQSILIPRNYWYSSGLNNPSGYK
ncbi:MAG: hypothetical protein WD512_14250 [Candidatus Paceibacterota bacterium]